MTIPEKRTKFQVFNPFPNKTTASIDIGYDLWDEKSQTDISREIHVS